MLPAEFTTEPYVQVRRRLYALFPSAAVLPSAALLLCGLRVMAAGACTFDSTRRFLDQRGKHHCLDYDADQAGEKGCLETKGIVQDATDKGCRKANQPLESRQPAQGLSEFVLIGKSVKHWIDGIKAIVVQE